MTDRGSAAGVTDQGPHGSSRVAEDPSPVPCSPFRSSGPATSLRSLGGTEAPARLVARPLGGRLLGMASWSTASWPVWPPVRSPSSAGSRP